MEEQQIKEEIKDQVNVKKLKRTDFKPIKYNFKGSSDKLFSKFLLKVRPIEGVIKYQLDDWDGFPTELEQAKKIAKEWADKFAKHDKFIGFVVNIYFHLEKKTIRFEVKKYVLYEMDKIVLTKAINCDEYKNQVFELIKPESVIYLFDCSCWDELKLEDCKDIGKNWATELESKEEFKNYKVIVFLNHKKKSIIST